jgi:hypothetical protein
MRAAFGLAGILVTIGVIAWIMYKVEAPDIEASHAVQQQAETLVNQLNGQDANGVKIEDTYKVFADSREDGKLQDLQITQVTPAGPMDQKFGLRANDVVIAAIDGHTVRTDLNGLNSEQEGVEAIHEAYTSGGQLVVQRGNQTLTLPLPKTMPNPNSPPLSAQMQQNAQKTEQQQEGKSNDGSENGTMDELHQRLHSLPGY